MRQHIWVAPWWQGLSCASMSAVYFWLLVWFESISCLYSNPLMCIKRSASCFGAFPFERCLENGSILCICSRACSLSSVSGFGVAPGVSVTVVTSDVTVLVLGCWVRSSVMLCYVVLLLVWNAGPSWLVAESIWTLACLLCGSSTSLDRQSTVLFWATNIHSKVMLYVASSNPICSLCYWHSFHFKIMPVVCGHFVQWLQLPWGKSSIL